MATESEHCTAVVDAYNAAYGPSRKAAYALDALPSPRPTSYLEVTVTRRYGGVQRFSGAWDGQLYRITARAVGEFADKARAMRDLCYSLEGQSLIVAGQPTTPIEFETADPLEPDAGWYSAVAGFTYALI